MAILQIDALGAILDGPVWKIERKGNARQRASAGESACPTKACPHDWGMAA